MTFLPEYLQFQKIRDEDYFKIPYISNSRLSLIDPECGGTPEKFFNGIYDTYTGSLAFGSALHELVLQPDIFDLCDTVDAPTGKLGLMAASMYKDWKEGYSLVESAMTHSQKTCYYEDSMNENRIRKVIVSCLPYWNGRYAYERTVTDKEILYLDPQTRDRIKGCLKAVQSNLIFQGILHPTGMFSEPIVKCEHAIMGAVSIEDRTYWLKSKLDHLIIDLEMNKVIVNDLKTLGRPIEEWDINFNRYKYYRELAIYSWLLSEVAKKFYGMPTCEIECNCLVVTSRPPYNTRVYKLTKRDLVRGWNEFKRLMTLVDDYVQQGYGFSDI